MTRKESEAILALKMIQQLVTEQSDNNKLWVVNAQAKNLKEALKNLHDLIERFTIPMFEN